jgi:perosamine synthetase
MFELDEPFVGKEELNYLKQAIDSGWISAMGPFVKKFEDKFAEYIGVKYAVSCASGTSAISLLCPTLKIKPGDEVILQSLTFTADAWAMHQAGAKIIFADCAKNTFSIDPEDVRKKITKKTKIISPTHLYGRPSRMDELREICDKNNIYLIEDCCQAMGSKYKDKMVGSMGDFNF